MLPLESVPNFSEGRDGGTIEAIRAALASAGARLLDVHSDADHNRSVFTFAGEPDAVLAAAAKGRAADYAGALTALDDADAAIADSRLLRDHAMCGKLRGTDNADALFALLTEQPETSPA